MSGEVVGQLGLSPSALRGRTVVITGAGGGIGLETARSALWLGANVVIAEIDETRGQQAATLLAGEYGEGRISFVPTDVGDEASVQNLYRVATRQFGRVDAVINNATIAELGKVVDLPIAVWDASYRVNLRGPVLMAQVFLPDMIDRDEGVFVCVSSTGTAYLGGYETFKAAQVHLATTLDAELEGTNVRAFTIGPGLVPTDTARAAVDELAPQLGLTVEAFYDMNRNAMLTAEEAGAGFAVALVFADRFRGMEISSLQALKAADISYGASGAEATIDVAAGRREEATALCARVRQTLQEQAEGWQQRNLFERQWVVRDFRKTSGMSADEWLAALAALEQDLRQGDVVSLPPLDRLAGYYSHLGDLARGYEKDPVKLAENLRYIDGWRSEVEALAQLVG